jgi:hypothetical protein
MDDPTEPLPEGLPLRVRLLRGTAKSNLGTYGNVLWGRIDKYLSVLA